MGNLKKDGFCIEYIPPANSENERGKRTWEYKAGSGAQVSIYFRKKREPFAAHFHKGKDPAKNPERFILLFGKVRVKFEDKSGKQSKIILDAGEPQNPRPVKLVIRPFILHWMLAETNCMYIEYRPSHFDPENSDTYPTEEF